MDVRARRHYVTPAMSFLLVLSAVFNALTGAFVGVGAAEPASHQQAPAEIAAVAEAVEQKAVPVAPFIAPLAVADPPAAAETPAPLMAPPLETVRLIE